MSPASRPADPTALDRGMVQRWLVTIGLAVLPWLIAPGRTQPDTKVDLTVSPWAYLGRSLNAWNDHAGLGELQNQAYGYLFPMGPVMGLAHSLGVPGWAAQRVWWTVLLLVAFLGMERLIRRLGIAGPGVALLGGLAYALSPRVLTVLSEISAEAWPLAVAPWLVLAVLPAVTPGASRRTLVHVAAASGLLTAALGGVNATASAVVLALPFLFLVTADRGARLRPLLWWAGGVVLGALWWVLPLFVLGRYAYPFLDFIETSQITTAVTSVPNTMRGASHWVAYILDSESHPVWQGGWVEAQSPTAIICTSVVAGMGAAGLLMLRRQRSMAHLARFAIASLVLGTVLMAVGHPGTAGGPAADSVQRLLDGALAPLRNVHKADPLLRLPVIIGIAYVVGRLARVRTPQARLLLAGSVVVVLASGTALWAGRVTDAATYAQIPQPWKALAAAVDRAADRDHGSTLLLPASRNAHYTWGSATDEPLSALASSPVVVRASAPLGNPASTRLLDRADELAASGAPQPGLAAGLARMGISRIVVRHDLATAVDAEPWRLVERTLASSQGFVRVQSFGKDLTLWKVDGPAASISAYDASARVGVRGGPESVFDLAAQGLLGTGAWSEVGASGDSVVTDSLRWRAYNNGRPSASAYGPTLPASSSEPLQPGAKDLPPAGDAQNQVTRELVGLRSLSVSSSAADPFARSYRGPGWGAAAAIDGDDSTAWISDEDTEATLDVQTLRPVSAGTVRVRVASGPGTSVPTRVAVTAIDRTQSTGRERPVTTTVPVTHGVATVQLRQQRVDSVTVTLIGAGGKSQMGIAELSIDGVSMGSRLRLPGKVDLSKQSVLIGRDPRDREASPRRGEDAATLTRAMAIAAPAQVSVSATVRPTWGRGLDQLLDNGWTITGSRSSLDPAARPGAAVDGDTTTRWVPAAGDELPSITIDFGRPVDVRGVRASGGGQAAVRVVADRRATRLGPTGGQLTVSVSSLTIQLVPPKSGQPWQAPELSIDGAPTRATPDPMTLPCGTAGSITLNADRLPLTALATRAQLVSGAPLTAQPCGSAEVALPSGDLTLTAGPGQAVQTESVLLRSATAAPQGTAPRGVQITASGTGSHAARVAAGPPSVLALTEGANAGWEAHTSDGRRLEPVTVDGWRQGFRLPDTGATDVTIEFTPTTAHRAGLLAGLAAVLLLLVAWILTRRRAIPRETNTPARSASAPAWVGGAAAVVVAGLVAGLAGVAVAVIALLVPRRWVPAGAAAGMALAGVFLATLGVVDQLSVGAVAGQLLGTFTLALLARGLWPGALDAGAVAPPAEPTTTP